MTNQHSFNAKLVAFLSERSEQVAGRKPKNDADDGLQLIGLRTPDLLAIVGCAHPLKLRV